MKIVKPYAKIMEPELLAGALGRIEYAARISHGSEDAQTTDSAERFIRAVVLQHGDWSVVEHVSASVEFLVDRGITHEIVRHRIASYTQSCVAGDTRLSPYLTIKEAVEQNLVGRKIKSSNGTQIVRNRIAAVFANGVQPIWAVVTKSGYRIKATMAHEFQIPSGDFVRLEDIAVGESVMVNGRPCLLKINDDQLRTDFYERGLNAQEIAEAWDAPYSSVTRRLRMLGIFRDYRNDKDKSKYNKNHTAESFNKMTASVCAGYRNGRKTWNTGLGISHPTVARTVEAMHRNQKKNGFGVANSNWKGGVRKTQRVEAQRKKRHVLFCEVCASKRRLEVHHIDENPANNVDENLIKLCRTCHLKVHCGFTLGIKPVADVIQSIIYVGDEPVYDLEMATHHNYVANGFIVHNSTRFINYAKKMPPSFIYPKPDIECPFCLAGEEPTPSGKHIIGYESVGGEDCKYDSTWRNSIDIAERAYRILLERGWRPQEARSVFPNALSSKIMWTMNLRGWRHVFLMRTSKEAHPQMRQVMIPLLAEFQRLIPVLYEDIVPESRQVDNIAKGR